MRYYWNGICRSSGAAYRLLEAAYLSAGYADIEELGDIWNRAKTSEEARDTLFMLSGYYLECCTGDDDA